jgi:hypothetical protein
MTYLSDKKRTRGYKVYGTFFILLFFLAFFWPTIRKFTYTYIESPILIYGSTRSGIVSIPYNVATYFGSKSKLQAENEALMINVERLENELAKKSSPQVPSDAGKTALELYPALRDLTGMYSTVVLSKGFKDGIEENDLAYLRGRQPVCVIAEVHDRTSVCKLLAASGNEIEGVTPAGETLFLKGNGGGSFIASVPRDSQVFVGDIISLKSDPTMALGTLVSINKDSQATSWEVYVRGNYNPVTSNIFFIDK